MSNGKAEFKRHKYIVSKVLETVLHFQQTGNDLNHLLTENLKFTKG